MSRRHPLHLPLCWLFTDMRLGDRAVTLAAHLPPGSGIVVRDDLRAPGDRWRLVRRLARIARARRLMLLLAASPTQARSWGADGVHIRQASGREAKQASKLGLIISMPVHNAHEARAAARLGAHVAFISPLFDTRSHIGGRAIGAKEFRRLARLAQVHPIALGGMNARRWRRLVTGGSSPQSPPGWAAIDEWVRLAETRKQRQKRNCVPI